MLRRGLLLAVAALFLAPSARAADPILPLAQVKPGMKCTGLSVLRGTTISQFGVEVLDVLGTDTTFSGPRILIRVSGPAIDATGIGPGFSGSPILCPGAGGALANAGAISEGLGEYGNKVALATPIEEVLTDAPAAAARVSRRPEIARAARPLASPLSVSGVSAATLSLLQRAASRAGTPVFAAPPGPAGGYPPQPLVPGAAVGAALSSGDVAVSAVGTVAYRDGARLWAFGHPFDAVGRRSLFLQDAYIFGIINNPLGVPELGAQTYKLASGGGNVQGTITTDAVAAVAGTVGSVTPAVPLTVSARERGGRSVTLESRLADERALGYGAGLSLIGPLAASQALSQVLRSAPPVTLAMCVRFVVKGRSRPLGFCNPYFGVDPALFDLSDAAALVDSFDLAPLDLERARVSMRVRRGVTRDVLVSAALPDRVRPGQRVRARVVTLRRGGERRRLSFRFRLPRDLRPGRQTVVLAGNGGEDFSGDDLILVLSEALGEEFGGEGAAEPRSVRQLARRLAAFRRPLGIELRRKRRRPKVVYEAEDVSFEGSVRVSLRVVRAGR